MGGMNPFAAPLAQLQDQLADLVRDAATGGGLQGMYEDELAETLAEIAATQRLVEAMLVDAIGEVMRRSECGCLADRMTSHLGCHDVSELVQRITRVSRPTATRLQRAAKSVRPAVSDTTGELCAAPLPEVRDAMVDGVIGLDGVLAIATPLQDTAARVMPDARRAAAKVLVAEARGEGPDGSPPLCADLLRLQAMVWATALDQDGAEPRERAAMRRRGVTLGAETSFGVPIRGTLLPEVAAQFQQIIDAQLSPRVAFSDPDAEEPDTDGPISLPDGRTRAQKVHDVFANVLSVAASSRLLPTIGGAAPTLVVSVTAEDVAEGTGYAHAQGSAQPLPVALARHVGCAGVIQRVTSGADGRILSIGVEERVFNRHQRRAIALRDGGCVIPGCGIPAGWCEIHHVDEHARGGPTHTDNGVLLCWYHHRFLDTIGWQLRMNQGVPEVRTPGWCDDSLRWRPVTTSPLRLRAKVRASGILRT